MINGGRFVTQADVTINTGAAQQLAAAEPNAIAVIIANLGAGRIRIGDANVTSTRGLPIAASGGTALLDVSLTPGIIYATNETVSGSVSVTWITK